MKTTTYICDRCKIAGYAESEMVTSVEVIFGGHGRAKSKVDGIDLCNECWDALVCTIRFHTIRGIASAALKPDGNITKHRSD